MTSHLPPVPTFRPFAAFCVVAALALTAILSGGCQLGGVIGANLEMAEEVDVQALYHGLDHQRVAVLVDAPMDIQYDHTRAVALLTDLVGLGIVGSQSVPGVQVLMTRDVLAYQNANVYWTTMDYSQLATSLGVSRIVFIDVIEYRLLAPGNSYVWDGRLVADINVFEADGGDSTAFGFSHRVTNKFPTVTGVARDEESQTTIENGLHYTFATKVARLFYDHKRIKYDLRKEKEAELD